MKTPDSSPSIRPPDLGPPTNGASRIARVGLALAIVLLIAGRLLDMRPPRVTSEAAPQDTFSAERARRHIEALAQKPRPVGSAAHREARDYLLQKLTELGLEIDVQEASSVGRWWGVPYDGAHVENVVGRIKGSASSGAVLLIAHYDSVPSSPGAGDDASGVAALLEAARALRAGPQPRNDVMFLFTDAEEAGALGAQAFQRAHRWSPDVRVALNFDARGSSGPAGLFDTSQGNAKLIRELADGAPHAVGSSLAYEVSRRMGHATDLKAFKVAGIPSMNFAFVDDAFDYHTPRDSLERLDLRSVQHMGAYALSLARRFSAADLRQLSGSDVVYFDVVSGVVLSYPMSLALPICALLLIACFAVSRLSCRTGRATPWGIARGALGFVAMVGSCAVLSWALLAGLRRIAVTLSAMRGDPYGATWYRIGLTLLGVAVAMAGYQWLRRKLTAYDVALGALLVWCVPLVATSLLTPGASYYFAWPLAGALAGAALGLKVQEVRRPLREGMALLLAALPAIAVATPGPYLLFMALQIPRGALATALVAFICGGFYLHFELLGGGRALRPAAALGAASLVTVAVTVGTARFSSSEPRPSCLTYTLDGASRRAAWITTDADPPPAFAPYFAAPTKPVDAFNPYDADLITRSGEAPVVELLPPSAAVVEEQRQDSVRRLRLKVKSARVAPEIFVTIRSSTGIRRALIDGQAVDEDPVFNAGADRPWGLRYLGASAEGFELVLDTQGDAPVEVNVVDRTYDLPGTLMREAPPPDIMNVPFYVAGSTFVGETFRF